MYKYINIESEANIPMPKCKPPKGGSSVNKPMKTIERYDKEGNLIEKIIIKG
jgi:hypothetical protein